MSTTNNDYHDKEDWNNDFKDAIYVDKDYNIVILDYANSDDNFDQHYSKNKNNKTPMTTIMQMNMAMPTTNIATMKTSTKTKSLIMATPTQYRSACMITL